LVETLDFTGQLLALDFGARRSAKLLAVAPLGGIPRNSADHAYTTHGRDYERSVPNFAVHLIRGPAGWRRWAASWVRVAEVAFRY